MNIPEAIEVSQQLAQDTALDVEEREAVRLGAEALKGIIKVRKVLRPYVGALLLGETED